LVRVTEAAALAAGRFMGRGDKEGGDRAAVDAIDSNPEPPTDGNGRGQPVASGASAAP